MTYGPFELKSYPCPLCGAVESTVVERKAGRAVPVAFTIVACSSCTHVRVDPRIPDERLDELYDDAYYRGNGFDATIDYRAEPTEATRAENEDIIASVADAAGGSVRGLRWLDVGCGTGTLLEQARAGGATVTGFDSSRSAAESCARKGLPLVTAEELERGTSAYDVVSAIEVIEHVPDPLAFLEFLRSHACDGGIVFVRTGNWNLVRRLRGTPYLMPEGHIQYFTPRMMRQLFARASLAEASAFNRTWILWRAVPRSIRAAVPVRAFALVAAFAKRFAPGVAPFPIGIREPRA